MFPIGTPATGLWLYVYVSADSDISLTCAKKCCGYVGCHYVKNVSNFGYEPIKFSSLKLIK